MDFAHARTSVARRGMRIPSVGPVPPSVVHPDTAGSDVFERFEALSARAKSDAESDARSRRDPSAVGGPRPRLQVTTQFDARVHDGTQRGAHGPKSYVDQSAPEKRGPLLELFLAYARRDDHRRRDAPLSFSKNDADESLGAGSLLSRAEVFGMMRDFAVVPSLVTERDARLAFAHADAPAAGDAAATNKENELDFHEFCRFLANAATLLSAGESSERSVSSGVLRDPEAGEQESAAAARRLLRHLECDSRDTRRLRAKVDEAFRLADRNPRAPSGREEDPRGPRGPRAPSVSLSLKYAPVSSDTRLEEARAVVVSMKGVSLDSRTVGISVGNESEDERGAARKRFAAAFAVLTRRENPERDAPAWTEFPSPAVDCGTLFPGETRRFRVRVANKRLNGSVAVSVRTEGVPCLEARFRETKILAPGLTETVQLVAGADAAGEWLGAVIVDAVAIGDKRRKHATDDPKNDPKKEKETVVVPVYLNVVHRDRQIVIRAGEPLGVRGYARADGVAGASEPGREAAFGFTAPPPPRGADAAERLRMRDPTFVSKRGEGHLSSRGRTNTHTDAFFSGTRARADAARAAAARVAANASARDRGWWGENSEERVFHEVANMREMARLEARRRGGETTGKTTGKTGKTGKTETAETAETAFRLSARGLRY